MKQSHDSSDNYKFPVTANETLSEKTAIFMMLLLKGNSRFLTPGPYL